MYNKKPLLKPVFAFFFYIYIVIPVFSFGGQDAGADKTYLNNEWVYAVTALDVSELPVSRQIIGGILNRSLTEALGDVEYRIRSNDEIRYYQDYAWSKTLGDAAKALAAKRNDRDLLLFRGDAQWKYSKNLAVMDSDIKKLEDNFYNAKTTAPDIAGKPLVKIQDTSTWPQPPEEGGEYNFCVNQKIDAFLAGKVTDYYGRIYLTLKLYTLYSRSYSWEDSILFSSEDMDSAVSEISGRLAAVLSGVEPAALVVRVNPDDAMIVIDDKWAGRGEAPLREYTPGQTVVSTFADNYYPVTYPVLLQSGVVTDLSLSLTPFGLSSFTVETPDNPDSSVFLGSLFLGKTPLQLDIPRDQYSYISVETTAGETGSAVYRNGLAVRGNAEFINAGSSLAIKTSVPVSPEEKRVATARNNFYSAYGRFWVTLPVTLLAINIAGNYINAYPRQNPQTSAMYNSALTSSYVQIGAYVLLGLSAAEIIYRIVRYLGTSGTNADPIAQFKNTLPENEQ